MVLRSDEQANEAEVERDQNFRGKVGKAITTTASIGTAAIGGPIAARAAGPLLTKVMPFLNQYIPAALAMKGINKVSPKLGAFLNKGQEMGLNVQDGLDFLKEKLTSSSQQQTTKEKRSILEQYSPELHKFISEEVTKGRSPIEAAALAQNDKRFADVIKKLTKDHKTSWSQIVEGIFGNGQYGGAVNPPQAQPQPKHRPITDPNDPRLDKFNKQNPHIPQSKAALQPQQMQQAQQQPQQQPGQGQQALMAIMQKINQKLGG